MDLAPNMLAAARELFDAEGFADLVELVQAHITALPKHMASADWDGVSCASTLHQLPDFDVLRGALQQIAIVRRNTVRLYGSSTFSA